jgi:hypothetical protein
MATANIGAAASMEFVVGMTAAANDDSTIERGSYGDRGVLEKGRPDGVGKPSNDQPNFPNPQPVKVPGNVTKPRK